MPALLSTARTVLTRIRASSAGRPLLPVTDAAAVAQATDGVILVCRYKETKREQLRTAVQALEAVSAPVLGTVFSMVPATGPRAYAQHHSYCRSHQVHQPQPGSRAAAVNVAPLPSPGQHCSTPRSSRSRSALRSVPSY